MTVPSRREHIWLTLRVIKSREDSPCGKELVLFPGISRHLLPVEQVASGQGTGSQGSKEQGCIAAS